jgi:DNA ligase-1
MRILFLLLLFLSFLFAGKPDLLLLKEYHNDVNITGWLMSEKLDGVRAYWDGKQLISRGGQVFSAPLWFTKDFPPFAIDGELWSKRGDFDIISGIVRTQKPSYKWKQLTYNIFEVPNQKGGLLKRLSILEEYLNKHPNKVIKILEQVPCKDKSHLKTFLKEVEAKGGEGVVVRNPDAPYISKRTSQALKVKSFQDTECEVMGYNEGKGKYENEVGSLICQMDNNKVINIGSGLSDAQRENPPKIGSIITFKYQGFTKNKVPRFPVFLRIKE